MREAVTQYVDGEEKPEAFSQDTLNAWEDFRENGLPVTADEAAAWMAQGEQGNSDLSRCLRSGRQRGGPLKPCKMNAVTGSLILALW